MMFLVVVSALLLDHLLGEAKRYHPLIGFGRIANWFERTLNETSSTTAPALSLLYGSFSVLALVLPIAFITLLFAHSLHSLSGFYGYLFDTVVLYWAIGLNSLYAHIKPIQSALLSNDTELARQRLSYVVSRDTENLDSQQITNAAIESTVENGSDAVFAALFWYCLGGVTAVVIHRLINTLDAMWGYRNERYELFGKTAAKLDDVVNYVPARLTAVSYAIFGHFNKATHSWRNQATLLASPNAGPVMTAGAGSLNVKLGGDAHYHGELIQKPNFGGDNMATHEDIDRALQLVVKSCVLWCAVILLIGSVE